MWAGAHPDAPNWSGSTEETGIAQIYTVSPTAPAFLPNPRVGIQDSNEVDLPRRYNDFAVNNLEANNINGNPNFDASNWWRYMAKGDVTAELLPPPPFPPVTQTRQYDLTGWKDIKCTNLTCETDPLLGGVMTCRRAVAPQLLGIDADFSTTEDGLADVNIYGANLLAGDNALYVEGGTTLTGGGVVHGVTIGALRAGPIDTVRIDVLPVGMSLESATFITANAVGAANVSAGGAASVAAGGALSLAGGSYIEYNSDQHYFRNTSAGNDFTDMYVGNIHGADGGTAPLRINESRGVEIDNVKEMTMYSEYAVWNKNTLFAVNAITYINTTPYKAVVQNKGAYPLASTIRDWESGGTYEIGNVSFVAGIGSYVCIANVSGSTTTPNGDGTHWSSIGSGNSMSLVWTIPSPAPPTPFASSITGDTYSTLTNGVVNTRTINLQTTPVIPAWDSATLYQVNDTVQATSITQYIALVKNLNVPPSGSNAPLWVSGGTYVIGNYVYVAAGLNRTYKCIQNVSGSTTSPNADFTNWAEFVPGIGGIWQYFAPPPVVVSTINGDENSILTIGTINAQNLVTNTSIDTVTIATNSITPHSGSSITINSGNLNLADNNITGVTTLTTRNLSAPSGTEINLQSNLNAQSQDGSLRSIYNVSLLQTRCETGADASVDFMYADGTTLAMEISVDEPANLAKIRTDVPLDITTTSGGLTINSTGTAITDNLVLTSAKLLDLNAPTGSVRVQANTFTAIAQQSMSLAAVNQDITLTATNTNINFDAPNGLVITTADFQLFNSRFGIPDSSDFIWVRAWYDNLLNYSTDSGANWRPVAQDWSKFAAEQDVNMNTFLLDQVGGVTMSGSTGYITDLATLEGFGGNLSLNNTNLTNVGTINGATTNYPVRVVKQIDTTGVNLGPNTAEVQINQQTITLKPQTQYQINMGFGGLVQNASTASPNNTWYWIVRVHGGTSPLTTANMFAAPNIFNSTQIGAGTTSAFMTTTQTTYTIRWYVRNQQPAGGQSLTIPNMSCSIIEIQ